MSRIFVCGMCPLPWENPEKNYGPGIRTWQFAWSLANAGHEVSLIAMKIDDAYGGVEPIAMETRDAVDIVRVTMEEALVGDVVKEKIARMAPDALVGATIYGSCALARWQPDVPFWADQFGHVMAEAQAKAALDGNNGVLPYFWRMVRPVVGWADRTSVVSNRQRYAAIGELGCAGRLGHETSGYEFVSVIPCAVPPRAVERPPAAIRGASVPEGSFVVLWSGGYNVWSDVNTLFGGLQSAMAKNSTIHFLSTGGGIPVHDDRTYVEFVRLVENSSMRDRFHLQGWVPADQVGGYWGQADLGVLTEHKMYEGELGDKNRVVQWLGYGLPVAYNRVGDLGDLLATHDLGLVFDCGDSDGLAQKILWASEHPVEIRAMAARARDYVKRELSFERSTVELIEWADRPRFAPDNGAKSGAWFPDSTVGFLATYIRSPRLRRVLSVPVVKRMLTAVAGRR